MKTGLKVFSQEYLKEISKDVDKILEFCFNREYVNYHKHCHYSNIMTYDSITKPFQYVNRCFELRHKNLFSTQHGTICGNYEYYDLCLMTKKLVSKIRKDSSPSNIEKLKKAKDYKDIKVQSVVDWCNEDPDFEGLEFRFGSEIYFCVNPNGNQMYHMMIGAKNTEGKRELTKLISECVFDPQGFHNKRPKVSLENIVKMLDKENVFITTACVGSYILKHEEYDDITKLLFEKFGDSFYLEVQSHDTPLQKEYNKRIQELSNKYGIKLIAGMDSHLIYPEEAEYRDAFLYSKGVFYDDEEGWDMDYPDYQTAVSRYFKQDILTPFEILNAMENARNICNDFEKISLNKDIKLPPSEENKHLNQEEKNAKYLKILNDNMKLYEKEIPKEDIPMYYEEIEKETKSVIETGMTDYFLLNYEIIKSAVNKHNGILTRTGRGSAPSFFTNKLLGFTDVDRIGAKTTMYPARFLSKARILQTKSLPDID